MARDGSSSGSTISVQSPLQCGSAALRPAEKSSTQRKGTTVDPSHWAMLFDVSVAVRSSTTNTKSDTTGRRYSTSMERRSRGGSLTKKAAEIMSGDDHRDELEGAHGDGGVGIHAELLLASEAD